MMTPSVLFHQIRDTTMDPDENKVELWEPKVWDDKNKGA